MGATDPKVNFMRNGQFKLDADGVAKLESRLVEFISENTGGPLKYSGRSMRAAHVGMKITDDESLAQMQGESDFRDHAWIRARVEQSERANGPGSVTAIRPREYGFDIDTMMNNAGWIVISEPAWRGWRAYVDDHRVGHQIANVAFLGVYVPRGAHHVRVVYWPQSFVIGRAITLATLLLLLSFCVAKTTRNLLAR